MSRPATPRRIPGPGPTGASTSNSLVRLWTERTRSPSSPKEILRRSFRGLRRLRNPQLTLLARCFGG